VQIQLPDLPDGCAWVDSIGHALIKKVTLEVGGQPIDEQSGAWLEICSELMLTGAQREGYRRMVDSKDWLFVPLRFWFCTNPGNALPLLALRFHEVKLHLELRTFEECVLHDAPVSATLAFKSFRVVVDYVYLDCEERKRFASLKHDYLITQTQRRTSPVVFDGKAQKIRLDINHPVKELVFTLQREGAGPLQWTDSLVSATILLNGHERVSQPAGYFRLVHPYKYHKRVPTAPIYVYSFAMRPEEHQPSGACNFSRVDTAHLVLTLKNHGGERGEVCVYAVNHNVFQVRVKKRKCDSGFSRRLVASIVRVWQVRNGLAGTSYAS
jgi:hypothetical protein